MKHFSSAAEKKFSEEASFFHHLGVLDKFPATKNCSSLSGCFLTAKFLIGSSDGLLKTSQVNQVG